MIQDYQANVLEAASLFEKYKGIARNDLARSRFEGFPKQGFLDPEQTIKYNFHGRGLCVTFPSRDIDWDFGYDGRLDGFDFWRLWVFARDSSNQFPEFKEKETLEKAFGEAENLGIIHKRFKDFQDNLYYLSSFE